MNVLIMLHYSVEWVPPHGEEPKASQADISKYFFQLFFLTGSIQFLGLSSWFRGAVVLFSGNIKIYMDTKIVVPMKRLTEFPVAI